MGVDAYQYTAGHVNNGALEMQAPTLTGVPFNDAYRYMDWLLTVPLLLIEILLVMKLDEATYSQKARTLGVGSALMIVSGYYGELTVTGDLTPRWFCWFLSMAFFLYIVYELLVGLKAAIESETDPVVKGKIELACLMTVVSWCTYPVVYLFPMLGISASNAVVSIQLGYCVSDIISKCGVGLVIYQITYAKSNKEQLIHIDNCRDAQAKARQEFEAIQEKLAKAEDELKAVTGDDSGAVRAEELKKAIRKERDELKARLEQQKTSAASLVGLAGN